MRVNTRSVLQSLALVCCLDAGLFAPAVAETLSLRIQLEALAQTEHIQLRGIEYLGPEETGVPPTTGTSAEKLKVLLKNYNYFVRAPEPNKIAEVVITSRLTPRPVLPPYQHVPITRVGSQHHVEGQLIGPNNVAIPLTLVIDTGASAVVLPMSMLTELGFDAGKLADGLAHTAGGDVTMKVGYLNTVRIGNLTAANVQVNFIADEKLGATHLLGMSFLDRFKMTIDDTRKELILLSK